MERYRLKGTLGVRCAAFGGETNDSSSGRRTEMDGKAYGYGLVGQGA